MEKFWVCYVEGSKIGIPVLHQPLQEAKEEAARLARLPDNMGKRVFILESVCYCELEVIPPPVIFHEIN